MPEQSLAQADGPSRANFQQKIMRALRAASVSQCKINHFYGVTFASKVS